MEAASSVDRGENVADGSEERTVGERAEESAISGYGE